MSTAFPGFVPIGVGDEDGNYELCTRGHFRAVQTEAVNTIPTRGMVEIELCGARIRVGPFRNRATTSFGIDGSLATSHAIFFALLGAASQQFAEVRPSRPEA